MISAARAVVDTSALRHNLSIVRQRAPGARIMAVVKANAYGHGLVPVARALGDADAFAVARVEEAVALRAAGIRQRIVLLEGVLAAEHLELAAARDLEPVIHCHEQLEMLEAAALSRALTVWLKIDTGMHRLGFPPEEARDLIGRLTASPQTRGAPLCMTHLACADEQDTAFTGLQLERFEAALAGLDVKRSVANSAGLLNYPETHVDWVRPGIMLYGASPFPEVHGTALGLRPAMTLSTPLMTVKAVRAGGRVGYGGTWTAREDCRIGIAAIGYGDGYPRRLDSGTPVLVGKHRALTAGRVSMDMIAVDVTRLPEARAGSEVVLWGEGLAVEELAARAGTIGYELLCGVTQRVDVTYL